MNQVHHFRRRPRAFGDLGLKPDKIAAAAEMIAAGHDNDTDRSVPFGFAQKRHQFFDEPDAVRVAFCRLKKPQDSDRAIPVQANKLSHSSLHQVPVQTGARFSAKAFGPSIASLLA